MLCETEPGRSPLYQRLLGADWDSLPEAVRLMHARKHPLYASGHLRVLHSRNVVARALVKLFGLPAAAESCEVTLEIVPEAGGERWVRRFGPRVLVSWQELNNEGNLLERFSGFDVEFKLRTAAGGIRYEQARCTLRLGLVNLPLPRFFSPSIEAEENVGADGCARIKVMVFAPVIGLVTAYEGSMRPMELEE